MCYAYFVQIHFRKEVVMFSQLTIEEIKYYVYCLVNPVDNRTFYIGKGKGNRVFAHAIGESDKDKNKEKIDLINSIRATGNKVIHIILRYGMTEDVAFEVESALIDYIGVDNLSNAIKGQRSERGLISCEELEIRFSAKPAEIIHSAMLVKINTSFVIGMNRDELYNATRGSWVANLKSVSKIKYVFAVAFGIIREVYEPHEWYKTENDRTMFDGILAPDYIRAFYKNKRVDNNFQNPISYVIVNDASFKTDNEELQYLKAKEERLTCDLNSVIVHIPQCCHCGNRTGLKHGARCIIFVTEPHEYLSNQIACPSFTTRNNNF